MRSEQLLIVLLAAVAAGRPVPTPHDSKIVTRELQYADIAAAYASHAQGAHDDAKVRRELQYSEIVALSGPPPAWHHGSKHHAKEGHHHWDGYQAREGHHHAGEGHGHFDGMLLSLFGEARSDISTRVLEGIKTFLSYAVRDVPEVCGGLKSRYCMIWLLTMLTHNAGG